MVALIEDSWLAGFVDGEGCFFISPWSAKRGHLPGLSINLRADDVEILRECQRVFGGVINLRPGKGNRAPQYRWAVHSKTGLTKLVDYFDTHPLRAKKRRDYAIWREAAITYVNSTCNHSDLPVFKRLLEEGRVYQDLPEEEVSIAPLRAVS